MPARQTLLTSLLVGAPRLFAIRRRPRRGAGSERRRPPATRIPTWPAQPDREPSWQVFSTQCAASRRAFASARLFGVRLSRRPIAFWPTAPTRTGRHGAVGQVRGAGRSGAAGGQSRGRELAGTRHRADKRSRNCIATEAPFPSLAAPCARCWPSWTTTNWPRLLKDLKDFFGKATLDNRHLTLASLTVGLVNRLDDDTAAASAYKQFGACGPRARIPSWPSTGGRIEKGAGRKRPRPAVEQP